MSDPQPNSRKRDTDSPIEIGMANHDFLIEEQLRSRTTTIRLFENVEAEIPLKRSFYVVGQNRWRHLSEQDACGIIGLETAIGLILKDPRSEQALMACLPHVFDEKSQIFLKMRAFLNEATLHLKEVEVFLAGSRDGGARGLLGRGRVLEFFHQQGISENNLYARWCKEGVTQSVFFDAQNGEIQYEEFDDRLLLDSPFDTDSDRLRGSDEY